MTRPVTLACLAICLLAASCASTKFETSGSAPTRPLCQERGQSRSALVLWGPQWRTDQKDVHSREEAARTGIESFLSSSGCFARYEVRRLASGDASAAPSRQELLALAATTNPTPDRVLAITVRELGPIVKLLSSAALVEGGTEVVLGITAAAVDSGALLANHETHWQHGGAMVVRGTSSLSQDMRAALSASLGPAGHAPP